MTDTQLTWVAGRLIRGHGVASGRDPDSPYPAGTISLQRPLFEELGLDLSACFAGTLNLSLAPMELRAEKPDFCFEKLRWTEFHPPETFRFWQVKVRVGNALPESGWIYQPAPETKVAHPQPPHVVEVLAPFLGDLAVGSVIDLGVDPIQISIIASQRGTA